MNANDYIALTGFIIGIISTISTFLFRDRYRTLINDIYIPGNQEVREQLKAERETNLALTAENGTLKGALKEKDGYIKHLEELTLRLPDLTKLAAQITSLAAQINTSQAAIIAGIGERFKAMVEILNAGKIDAPPDGGV